MNDGIAERVDLQAAFLEPGEAIRWQGRPSAIGLVRARAKEGLTGLTLLFFAWLCFQAVMEGQEQAGLWAGLQAAFADPKLRYVLFIGAVMLPVSIWMGSEPIRAYLRANSIIYLVTDRRALILGRGGIDMSYLPDEIFGITVKDRAFGGDDVMLAGPPEGMRSLYKKHFSHNPARGLFGLADAQGAAAAIGNMRPPGFHSAEASLS